MSALYSAVHGLGATSFKLATANDAYVAIGVKGRYLLHDLNKYDGIIGLPV